MTLESITEFVLWARISSYSSSISFDTQSVYLPYCKPFHTLKYAPFLDRDASKQFVSRTILIWPCRECGDVLSGCFRSFRCSIRRISTGRPCRLQHA